MTPGPRIAVGLALGILPVIMITAWVSSASERLEGLRQERAGEVKQVAVAQASNANYCRPELQKILRRVLQSCGLMGKGGGRGCQPLEAKNIATVSGKDFNALFREARAPPR